MRAISPRQNRPGQTTTTATPVTMLDEQPQSSPSPAPVPAKTVVVGVRPDQQSRDLLTWSLLNLPLPGDTVIALHAASPPPSHRSKNSCIFDPAALLPTIQLLNSMIATYEGFCNLKQIDLKLKFVRGPSACNLLTREVKSLSAAALVVGVADNGSASVAKHCAKKLPDSCAVLAVNVHGKIIYQSDSVLILNQSSQLMMDSPTEQSCPVCARRPEEPVKPPPVLTSCRTSPIPERSRISVVRWALSLPSRYSTFIKSASIPDELEALREKYAPICRVFGYQELATATANFSNKNVAGRGGSSSVYKGYLSDGKQVAVKMIKHSEESVQEFVSEVEIITALDHKNVVSLIGFCIDGGNENLMLVYDFLSRGTLEEVLHGEGVDVDVLGWSERYKIAVGVAKALDYLHGGCGSDSVIHRDVKSSNILLPDDLEPKLCDFGIAKWASLSSTHISHRDVVGTFGYMAPEYFLYGKVDEKVDVYAFGVVLLELISGREPVSLQSPKSRESLVMWAKPILQEGKFNQLTDPKLGDKYDYYQMERMALAASLCIRRFAQSRPCIALILKLLQGGDDSLKWARSEIGSGSSEDFSRWDDETSCADSDIQSHINLALLDIDDETTSVCSLERSVDYMQGR